VITLSDCDASAAGDIPQVELGLNRQRVAQTKDELARLHSEIKDWLCDRNKKDVRKQHTTQLKVLGEQLERMLGEIERSLGTIPLAPPQWQTYSECRRAELRLLWVRRIWGYFQSKFDQRQNNALKGILEAADEVIWSSYVEPFRQTKRDVMPVPLPFVASYYSPAAVPRDEPPQDLRSDVDADFLNAMLSEMPIPVVALPPNCVDEPWRLAYVAHEVGHHVQADLLPDGGLIDTFADILEANGGERWRPWSQEIFADLYSLLAIGHWALWALTEMVWGTADSMLNDTSVRYPSPLVRLLLMQAMADKLGLNGTAALRGTTAGDFLDGGPVMSGRRNLREAAEQDIKKINAVSGAALANIPQVGELKTLVKFNDADFKAPAGFVHLWAETLAGRTKMLPQNHLRNARLVLGGGVQSFATAAATSEAERARVADLLKRNLPGEIVAHREEILRSAPLPATIDLRTKGDRLAALLFADERAYRGA
jgi:hypothetical protein